LPRLRSRGRARARRPVSVATPYVRNDGGTDRAIQQCSDTSSSTGPTLRVSVTPTPTTAAAFRQGNEPSVAIDPTNSAWVAAGRDLLSPVTVVRAGRRPRSPATQVTPRSRAWPPRFTARTPRRAIRCSPSTATETSSPVGSPSTGSTRRTAICGWPPTPTTPGPAPIRKTDHVEERLPLGVSNAILRLNLHFGYCGRRGG